MLKRGMNLLVPPACDPTVPLLGPYQMAGFAQNCGYEFRVCDFNRNFTQYIIEFAQKQNKFCHLNLVTEMSTFEKMACISFVKSFPEITSYKDLINAFHDCSSTKRYWALIDYVRACYDMYSLDFQALRFRIDGLDCKFKWNVWSDIEAFLYENSNSAIMELIRGWVRSYDFMGLDTVGINITFESQLFLSLLFCKAIREIRPDLYIIVGGGFVNSFIDSVVSIGPLRKYCDTVFSQEGEALIWYLNSCENESASIRFLGEQGEKGCANFVTAKDICKQRLRVSPPFIPAEQLATYLSPKRVLPLRFTYKCYWGQCKFCTDQEYHYCLSSNYDYSAMIEYCISGCKAGLFDCVYFLDSAISADVLKRFCNEIIASGAKFSWGTNSRFDDVFANDEFIKLMADAGCVFIKFGLESGSQRVLDMMNKGTKIDNASIIINLCRTHGIFVHTYVMFAYPGETEDDRKITQEFLLSDYSHPDNYNCSEFILYGTAPIAKELNYSFESDFSKEGWHSSSYSFSNSNIKSSISKMRELFTQKYQPASVLASTGHTIALAKQLTKNPARSPIVREDSVLLLSNTAISIELAGKAFLGKWRRHDGFIYFSGDWASTVRNLFINITTRDALNNGISLATIFDLIAENFITITQEGVGNAVQSIGESEIIFQYGHSFDTMKWYGYSDLD